jgi:hypothetical protein
MYATLHCLSFSPLVALTKDLLILQCNSNASQTWNIYASLHGLSSHSLVAPTKEAPENVTLSQGAHSSATKDATLASQWRPVGRLGWCIRRSGWLIDWCISWRISRSIGRVDWHIGRDIGWGGGCVHWHKHQDSWICVLGCFSGSVIHGRCLGGSVGANWCCHRWGDRYRRVRWGIDWSAVGFRRVRGSIVHDRCFGWSVGVNRCILRWCSRIWVLGCLGESIAS